MKCPKCGKMNGKTNKFCRECGLKLDDVIEAIPQPTESAASDEVVLGEQLFDVWQLFESGDLDVALGEGEKIIRANSESTSARSLVALIYERKAEFELADGHVEPSHAYLKLAINQYEKIIDLNPDSTADREKLVSLRMKLTGHSVAKGKSRFDYRALLNWEVIKKIPPQYIAPAVAVIVIVPLAIILTAGGKSKSSDRVSDAREAMSRRGVATVTSDAPASSAYQAPKVYTFPAPSSQPSSVGSSPHTPPRMQTPSIGKEVMETVKPVKLPSIIPEVTVVPESKAEITKKPEKPKPVQEKSAETPKEHVSNQNDGASMFAQATLLYSQGNGHEAMQAAEQAKAMFQADIDAGKNTDSARRGVENAKKLIAVLQQSGVNP